MKKEYLVFILALVISIISALLVFKLVFPQIFSKSVDLEIVQLDKKIPPFFESIFRKEDLSSTNPILKDPILNVRGKPLLPAIKLFGPHDVLGFRNTHVPRVVDVITIGDSQTYGMNAAHRKNWPSALEKSLKNFSVYNMSLGGFSAPQYFKLYEKATLFKPQVIILALYSGNDPLEAFHTVYNIEYWKSLRPNMDISKKDSPNIGDSLSKDFWWKVQFKNSSTIFTPKRRLISHQKENKAVNAGYKITLDILKRINKIASSYKIPTIITVIPTKELSYHKKIEVEKITAPQDYTDLISAEKSFIELIKKNVQSLSMLQYVNVSDPLTEKTLQRSDLYPSDADGHPLSAGYSVIANALKSKIQSYLHELEDGLYKVSVDNNNTWFYELREKKLTFYQSALDLKENGKNPNQAIEADFRLLERYDLL